MMREEKIPQAQAETKEEKPQFKSKFKLWIRVVAFIVVAVFLPEQVAQAVEFNWQVLWGKPITSTPFAPTYLKDLNQVDIALAVRNVLKDLAGKPVTSIQISPTITLELEKPLNITQRRIEEIYQWLQGKPCGSKALFDYLHYKGASVPEQDIAVMALTIDILNGVVEPKGNPEIINTSLFALARTSEFFGHKLYPVKLATDNQQLTTELAPFIAHFKGDHYVLVTKITEDKVYYSDNHKEEFLSMVDFLMKWSRYALISAQDAGALLDDQQAKEIKGAGWSGGYITSSSYDDGSGDNSMAGGTTIPRGFSLPKMPSVVKTSVTPTYYFPQTVRVNSQGFTNIQGTKFIQPVAMAYTSVKPITDYSVVPTKAEFHSVPVWFHNGLDGRAFHHDSWLTKRMDQSFVKGLGLNKVSSVGTMHLAHTKGTTDRAIYKTGTGLILTYSAVQDRAAVNTNLKNMQEGKPSTKSEWRNPNDPLSNTPANVNVFNLDNQHLVFAIDGKDNHFSWNYGFGAYLKPGDKVYQYDSQELTGVGTTSQIQGYAVRSHPGKNRAEGAIGGVSNGLGYIPTTGTWDLKGGSSTASLGDGATVLKGAQATVLDGYLQARGSDGLVVEHYKAGDEFALDQSTLRRNIVAVNGPIDAHRSVRGSWERIKHAENVKIGVEVGGKSTAVLDARLSPHQDGSLTGSASDWIYHTPLTDATINPEATPNDGPQNSEITSILRRTTQVAPYIYRSSTDVAQPSFDLNLKNQQGDLAMDASALSGIINDGRVFKDGHTFYGGIKDFVSLAQVKGGVHTADFVAATNENYGSTLDGMTARFDNSGFSKGSPGIISKYKAMPGQKAYIHAVNAFSNLAATVELEGIDFKDGTPVQGSLKGLDAITFKGMPRQKAEGIVDAANRILVTSSQDMPRLPVFVSTVNSATLAAKNDKGEQGNPITQASVDAIKHSGYDVFAKGNMASGQRIDMLLGSTFSGSMSLDQRNMNYHSGPKPLLDFATIVESNDDPSQEMRTLGKMQMLDGNQVAYFSDTGAMVSGTGKFKALSTNKNGLYVDHAYETNGAKTHGGYRYDTLVFEYMMDPSGQSVFAHDIKQHGNLFESTAGSTAFDKLVIEGGKIRVLNARNMAYMAPSLAAADNVAEQIGAYNQNRDAWATQNKISGDIDVAYKDFLAKTQPEAIKEIPKTDFVTNVKNGIADRQNFISALQTPFSGSLISDLRSTRVNNAGDQSLAYAFVSNIKGDKKTASLSMPGGAAALFGKDGGFEFAIGRHTMTALAGAGQYVAHTWEGAGKTEFGGYRVNRLDFTHAKNAQGSYELQALDVIQAGNTFESTSGATTFGKLNIRDGKIQITDVANLAYIPAILVADSNAADAFKASQEAVNGWMEKNPTKVQGLD
ncbi:MAG: hypothetical protein KBA46_01250, partial [Candidatus Omnitrophica bacterium]|nr:hypothetical protein [Candidatus Omnitrophota bacterium]